MAIAIMGPQVSARRCGQQTNQSQVFSHRPLAASHFSRGGFNWPTPDHFRVVFLPNTDDLTDALGRIERFLAHYRKRHCQ